METESITLNELLKIFQDETITRLTVSGWIGYEFLDLSKDLEKFIIFYCDDEDYNFTQEFSTIDDLLEFIKKTYSLDRTFSRQSLHYF